MWSSALQVLALMFWSSCTTVEAGQSLSIPLSDQRPFQYRHAAFSGFAWPAWYWYADYNDYDEAWATTSIWVECIQGSP